MGGVSGTTRSAVGTYSEECTATSTTGLRVLGGPTAGEGDIDNVRSFTNRTVWACVPKYVAPAYAGTYLDGTAMGPSGLPWKLETVVGLRFKPARLKWTAPKSATNCLHNGSGATAIVCLTPRAFSTIFFTDGGATTTGADLIYTTTAVYVRVANKGATWDLIASYTPAMTMGSVYVLTLRIASGTDGVTVRQNKVTKLTASLTAPSSGDSSYQLTPGYNGGTDPDFDLHDFFVANRVLTDDECAKIEDDMYLRATGSPMP